MSDTIKDAYDPEDLKSELDMNKGTEADSIQFVTVPGEDKIFLYLWDTTTDEPVASVCGFTPDGVEMLQGWLTNVDMEARQDPRSDYGDGNE